MKQFRVLATALAAALLVAACGGGGDGDQSPAIKYTKVVSFGDSLSDAGTYGPGLKQAGLIQNASLGGMFTINGVGSTVAPVTLLVTPGSVGADTAPSYNWAQLVSAAAVGKVNCAARVGGFSLVEIAVAGCTNYAQGGARVESAFGVGNHVGVGNTNGPLTEPVATQIQNYIADGGTFSDKQLFTVLAGANDIFGQTDKLTLDATAAGNAAGATAFGTAVVSLLAADSPNPATAAGAIATGMGQAQAAAATLPGATSNSVLQAAVTGAVQAAGAAGNPKVLDMAYIGAAVAPAQAAATTAGGNAFGVKLITDLVGGVPAINQAAASTSIPLAMGAAQAAAAAAPGATADSIMAAAAGAAIQEAALKGNLTAGAALVAAGGGNMAGIDAITAPAKTAAVGSAATAFSTSLATSFAADASAVTASTSIKTAMSQAFAAAAAAPGATSTSILTAMGNAAVPAAAAAGNTKVMNMTYINGVAGAAQAAATTAGTTAGNNYAATTGAATAVAGMKTAASALVAQIKDLISRGAKHVVVVNLPDVSQTPMALATIVRNTDGTIKDDSQQKLVLAMTQAFNDGLEKGLIKTSGVAGSYIDSVVFVDAFAENRRQLANKEHYALTNVKDVACTLTSPANVLATTGKADGSSLVCNASNLIAGDTSHYLFADNVHPTPFGHKLLAQFVTKALVIAGWL